MAATTPNTRSKPHFALAINIILPFSAPCPHHLTRGSRIRRLNLSASPDGGLIINACAGRRIIEVDKQGKLMHEWRTGSQTIASSALVDRGPTEFACSHAVIFY